MNFITAKSEAGAPGCQAKKAAPRRDHGGGNVPV
jgi:hypothetical protein